jgi:hypothetical protein
MSKDLSRRVLLRGLGGAIVAAPFLSSVAERAGKTAGLTPSTPKRLIVMFTYNGCLTTRWFPAKSHGSLTRSDYAALQTLAPMAPYADKLLMVRGIRAMNEWSFEGTLGQKNDPHTQVCGSYFTCHPVTPNATMASASNPGKFDAKPTGRSLDHVCAEQLNATGSPPLFIQIGGVQGASTNTMTVISYDQPEHLFPGTGSPVEIFTTLTNLFGPGPVSGDSYMTARRKGVIDCVREDLNNLRRVDMSASDKRKLSAWADLLNETGKVVTTECNADNATKLGLTGDSVEEARLLTASNDLPKIAKVMMDLTALSAMCDANRVIFMKFPQNIAYKFLGITADSLSLSHRTGNALLGGACIKNALEMIATIDAWYAQQFAYLVGRLDGITEGDRTLLDNTATVWFQEMSDGSAANLNNLPILQAGSCGDYFKVGQAVNVEGGKADLTQGHSEDDCKDGNTVMPIDLAGTPPEQATMPINKYYCNLMNAIGVKAGPDGFPVKGGTEPVTKYGKYDDTRLFPTDAPAVITNPGEFTELRAS